MLRRAVAVVALLGLGALTAALLLSDRAPSLYRGALERAFAAGRAVRDWLGLDVSVRSVIPIGAEQGGHIALFFAATVVVGVLLRRRLRPSLSAGVVLVASAAFELAQPLLSSTRHQQVDDLVANAIGVALGYLVLRLLRRILGPRRRRSLAW